MKVSTAQFTWNGKTLTFAGDVSELEHEGWEIGVGLTLVNPKTGGEGFFKYGSQIWEGEELSGWRYLCQRPGLPDVHLIVFND